MSRNGSSPEIKTETIMKEWLEELSKIREKLYALRKPWDRHRPVEDELRKIILIVHASFAFGKGDVPSEIDEADVMLWNYPQFARDLSERARELEKTTREEMTTRELISCSLGYLTESSQGNANVRQKVLVQLFGPEGYKSKIHKNCSFPEDQAKKIKENKKVKQKEVEQEQRFIQIAGRKNI